MKITNVDLFREGLYEISRGFQSLAQAIEAPELAPMGEVEIPPKEYPKEYPVLETPMRDEEVEVEAEVEEKEEMKLEKEVLDKMNYRDLQKLAKDLDILATGKKEELVARISGEEIEVEELSEEVEEIVEEVVEIQEEIEEGIQEEEVELNRGELIEQSLSEYTEEDLADILSSLGLSPKGKRQALIAKIIKAEADGLIEIELEEPREEVEIEPLVEEEMTEARRQRIMEVKEEVKDMFKNEEMSESQVNDILAYVYSSDGFSPSLPLNERKDMVEEMYVNLVDDEGQSQELEVPYERGGEYACCSHTLRKKENGNLHCKVCDQEYQIG